MAEEQVSTGTIPFPVDSSIGECSTFYKVIGDLKCGNPPVVALHGGPGSGHEYMLPLGALWSRYQHPVVLYDQIGCASSTHLKQKLGDRSFWTVDLFVRQLKTVLGALHLSDGPGYYLLGHSFGGMITSCFATTQPHGLKKLILASTPASFDLYRDSLRLNFKLLSQEAQDALVEADETGDYKSPRFKGAELSLLQTFWCRATPFPGKDLVARTKHQTEDPTVFQSMYGPTLLQCTGSLQGWDCVEALPQINVPTLVYNGEHDTTREIAFKPFVNKIPGAREATIKTASHMAHLDTTETREQVLELVGTFLSSSS